MVGFFSELTTTVSDQETEDCINQSLKLKSFKEPLENFDPKLSDLSFADSLLDFDYISEFLEANPEADRLVFERSMESNNTVNSHFEDSVVDGFDPVMKVENEKLELDIGGKLTSCIEEDMKRVTLVGDLSSVNGDNGVIGEGEKVDISHGSSSVDANVSVVKAEVEGVDASAVNVCSINDFCLVTNKEIIVDGGAKKDKDDDGGSESDSESDDTSSSSSSSSSDSGEDHDDNDGSSDEETEEGGKEKLKTSVEKNREVNVGEMEEGEIAESKEEDDDEEDDDEEEVDKMVGWDDIEMEDEEDAGAGPIRSKNELQDLPPVPPVNVTLEPHHQMLPVGGVLSVLGAQVIVEGAEKHSPLSEGSLLWITESRSPLGWVDEIFGPVKNPYYVVRYNSESEVPTGIHVGSSISFVAEFANHVLNDQNLYKKGYDASGENDEELSEELEFSDDEKEAEYKRMLKMSKRGNNDQTMVGNKRNNRKKGRNRDRNWNNNKSPSDQTPTSMGPLPINQNQNNVSPVGASISGAGLVQQLSTMTQPAGVFQPPNGFWGEGMNLQQPMSTVLPLGFPPNNMPWPQQNQFQFPYQMPVPNSVPFPLFNPAPAPQPNPALLGGQQLFLGGPTFSSWPAAPNQNPFNQTTFGMGLGSQPPQQQFMNVMNMGDQEITSNVSSAEGNSGQVSVDAPARRHFNMGSRGRKPHHRGGRRFEGGRGRGR